MRPALLAAFVGALMLSGASGASAAPLSLPWQKPVGGAFHLIDQDGRQVSERSLMGRPTAIFFGFTYCPEVCPTTLTRIGHWLKALGPDGDRLNVVFVSVDSERDTPKALKRYLSDFDPRIKGFTGTPQSVAQIARGYHVYYRKILLPGKTYTYEHSAAVYLMDAQGRFVEPIGYGEADGMALASLRRLLGR